MIHPHGDEEMIRAYNDFIRYKRDLLLSWLEPESAANVTTLYPLSAFKAGWEAHQEFLAKRERS